MEPNPPYDLERQAFDAPFSRQAVPAAEETVSYPVFPFVMVRSPRPAAASAAGRSAAY